MWLRLEFAICMAPLAQKNTHAVQGAEHHTNKNYREEIHRSIMRSNEEEISYDAVSGQGCWRSFHQGDWFHRWLDLGRVPCGQHGH